MLVKIKNDSKEFESKVTHLKSVLNVVAASKVAEYCVENYAELDARYHKSQKQVERLMDLFEELKNHVRQKESAEQSIKILLGENL